MLNQALVGLYPGKEVGIEPSDLVYPPQSELGDLSLPCFVPAKQAGVPPAEIASALVGRVKAKGCLSGAKAVGPYFNLTLNTEVLARDTLELISAEKGRYGYREDEGSKRIMFEFSNGNTHKVYHIGHVRNIALGDAVTRITAANGYTSIPVSYINDFGIHVAKTLWQYQDFVANLKKETGEDINDMPDNRKGCLLGEMYAQAARKEKEDKTAKGMIEFMMKKIESREGEEYELWKRTREWSIAHFDKIYKELGIWFERIFYESEFVDQGRKMVKELVKKGILKESEGAIIADLQEYDLGVLVFVRSDGTAMYPVADLPLARKKIEEFQLDTSVYIVDVRQELYFKQLFKIIELLGYECETVHLGYEFVKLPSGMMSSRSGNIMSYDELKEKVFNKALAETKERHSDWSRQDLEKVAGTIANGAIKFEMCKVGAKQIITFDIDQALQFEGYTAAYLQYTYARSRSILRKAEGNGLTGSELDYAVLEEQKEKELLLKLAKYPEEVLAAGKVYDPSVIARYAFDLARLFNDYYHAVPVIQSDKRLAGARLKLVEAVSRVIANALGLLGIEVMEEM